MNLMHVRDASCMNMGDVCTLSLKNIKIHRAGEHLCQTFCLRLNLKSKLERKRIKESPVLVDPEIASRIKIKSSEVVEGENKY